MTMIRLEINGEQQLIQLTHLP